MLYCLTKLCTVHTTYGVSYLSVQYVAVETFVTVSLLLTGMIENSSFLYTGTQMLFSAWPLTQCHIIY